MSPDSRRAGGGTRRRRAYAVTAAVVVAVVGVITTLAIHRSGEPAARPAPTSTWPSVPERSAASPRPIRTIGEPTRLLITSIGVDARVIPVGTTPSDAQEVPASIDATGWWRDGSRPGQSGNAVIVGHTASRADGVFDDLGKLERNETIEVRSKAGTLTYAVTSEREVPVKDFGTVADDVYRETGRSGLVLMTCGDWNGNRFETTVIVEAKPVRTTP